MRHLPRGTMHATALESGIHLGSNGSSETKYTHLGFRGCTLLCRPVSATVSHSERDQ